MKKLGIFAILVTLFAGGAVAAYFALTSARNGEDGIIQGKDITEQGGKSAHEWVTGEKTDSGRNEWDALFDRPEYVYGKEPIPFLKKSLTQLKSKKEHGNALVLAMGEGRNAVYLAKEGFKVTGIDISKVALRKAHRLATENHVKIKAVNANLKYYKIIPNSYDVIVNVTYFRDGLIPHIKKGLKKGGYVLFQNYTTEHLKNPSGASVPKRFVLQPGELKRHFSDFDIVHYSEKNNGKQAMAWLLARKK